MRATKHKPPVSKEEQFSPAPNISKVKGTVTLSSGFSKSRCRKFDMAPALSMKSSAIHNFNLWDSSNCQNGNNFGATTKASCLIPESTASNNGRQKNLMTPGAVGSLFRGTFLNNYESSGGAGKVSKIA